MINKITTMSATQKKSWRKLCKKYTKRTLPNY